METKEIICELCGEIIPEQEVKTFMDISDGGEPCVCEDCGADELFNMIGEN